MRLHKAFGVSGKFMEPRCKKGLVMISVAFCLRIVPDVSTSSCTQIYGRLIRGAGKSIVTEGLPPFLQLPASFQALIVNPKKLETGKRTNSAGLPHTLLFRIEAIGFPTFGLLLYPP